MQTATVGELLDSILSKTGALPVVLSAEQRARRIANPPEVIAIPSEQMYKIKLEDGSYLNLRVRYQ